MRGHINRKKRCCTSWNIYLYIAKYLWICYYRRI